MFHNYFFLKRLAHSLNEPLKSLQLSNCFSQNKDELILGFSNPHREFWIRANLDPNLCLLHFPSVFHRAGKNSIDLFSELLDLKVMSVSPFLYERSFQIVFEKGYALIFKMHGRRSNILLAKEDEISSIFRNSLKQDLEIIPSKLDKAINLTYEAFAEKSLDPLLFLPALGKEVGLYWNENFADLSQQQKWDGLCELLKKLEQNPIRLHAPENRMPKVSLFIDGQEQTDDPVYATNWLYEKSTRSHYFEKEKTKLINQLKQKVRQSENYIFKTSEKLRSIKARRSPEEVANIIMANLGLIQSGLSKVTLHDFYHNNFIEIKLNPKLSPQRNAENYYRKSKNRHQEEGSLEKNIEEKEALITQINQEILTIENIQDHRALKNYQKTHKKDAKNQTGPTNKNYHEFNVEGWQILIGKNAKANDELTLKVAKKDDLWLHAKDVSGSHVVIKQTPGQNFPNQIIEEAAAFAAFFSKRKTESLCPVIYTPKKFVRKVKGTPPGQVIVEKEQVVMVVPKEPRI